VPGPVEFPHKLEKKTGATDWNAEPVPEGESFDPFDFIQGKLQFRFFGQKYALDPGAPVLTPVPLERAERQSNLVNSNTFPPAARDGRRAERRLPYSADVTFQFRPRGIDESDIEAVYLAGSFNDWKAAPEFKMRSGTRKGETEWMITSRLKEGTYEYKYLVKLKNGQELWVSYPDDFLNSERDQTGSQNYFRHVGPTLGWPPREEPIKGSPRKVNASVNLRGISVEKRAELLEAEAKDGKTRIHIGTATLSDGWELPEAEQKGLAPYAAVIAEKINRALVPVSLEYLELPGDMAPTRHFASFEYDYFLVVDKAAEKDVRDFISELSKAARWSGDLGRYVFVHPYNGTEDDLVEQVAEKILRANGPAEGKSIVRVAPGRFWVEQSNLLVSVEEAPAKMLRFPERVDQHPVLTTVKDRLEIPEASMVTEGSWGYVQEGVHSDRIETQTYLIVPAQYEAEVMRYFRTGKTSQERKMEQIAGIVRLLGDREQEKRVQAARAFKQLPETRESLEAIVETFVTMAHFVPPYTGWASSEHFTSHEVIGFFVEVIVGKDRSIVSDKMLNDLVSGLISEDPYVQEISFGILRVFVSGDWERLMRVKRILEPVAEKIVKSGNLRIALATEAISTERSHNVDSWHMLEGPKILVALHRKKIPADLESAVVEAGYYERSESHYSEDKMRLTLVFPAEKTIPVFLCLILGAWSASEDVQSRIFGIDLQGDFKELYGFMKGINPGLDLVAFEKARDQFLEARKKNPVKDEKGRFRLGPSTQYEEYVRYADSFEPRVERVEDHPFLKLLEKFYGIFGCGYVEKERRALQRFEGGWKSVGDDFLVPSGKHDLFIEMMLVLGEEAMENLLRGTGKSVAGMQPMDAEALKRSLSEKGIPGAEVDGSLMAIFRVAQGVNPGLDLKLLYETYTKVKKGMVQPSRAEDGLSTVRSSGEQVYKIDEWEEFYGLLDYSASKVLDTRKDKKVRFTFLHDPSCEALRRDFHVPQAYRVIERECEIDYEVNRHLGHVTEQEMTQVTSEYADFAAFYFAAGDETVRRIVFPPVPEQSLEERLKDLGIQESPDERFTAIYRAAIKINPKLDLKALFELYQIGKSHLRVLEPAEEAGMVVIITQSDSTRLDTPEDDARFLEGLPQGTKKVMEGPFLVFLKEKFGIRNAYLKYYRNIEDWDSTRHYMMGVAVDSLVVPEEFGDLMELYYSADSILLRRILLGEYSDVEAKVDAGVRQLGKGIYQRGMGNKEAGFLIFEKLGLPYPPGIALSAELASVLAGIQYEERPVYDAFIKRQLNRIGIKIHSGGYEDLIVRSNPKRSMPGILESIRTFNNPVSEIQTAAKAWESPKAKVYRKREGIPDAYDLPLIVQKFESGKADPFGQYDGKRARKEPVALCMAGAFSTRDPNTNGAGLFGRYSENADGSELMTNGKLGEDLNALAQVAPEIYTQLVDAAKKLEDVVGPQEVEFVVNHGKLYFVQTRRINFATQAEIAYIREQLAANKITEARAIPQLEKLQERLGSRKLYRVRDVVAAKPVATAPAATPGAMQGHLAWSVDRARELIREGKPVIFVAREKDQDELLALLFEYSRSGLLTLGYGNASSHEAVLSRLSGIPSLINVAGTRLDEQTIVLENGQKLREGDVVVVDGDHQSLFVTGEDVLEENGVALDASYGIHIPEFKQEFLKAYLQTDGSIKPEFTVPRLVELNQQAEEKFKTVQNSPDKKAVFTANLEKHFIHELLGRRKSEPDGVREREAETLRAEMREEQISHQRNPAERLNTALKMAEDIIRDPFVLGKYGIGANEAVVLAQFLTSASYEHPSIGKAVRLIYDHIRDIYIMGASRLVVYAMLTKLRTGGAITEEQYRLIEKPFSLEDSRRDVAGKKIEIRSSEDIDEASSAACWTVQYFDATGRPVLSFGYTAPTIFFNSHDDQRNQLDKAPTEKRYSAGDYSVEPVQNLRKLLETVSSEYDDAAVEGVVLWLYEGNILRRIDDLLSLYDVGTDKYKANLVRVLAEIGTEYTDQLANSLKDKTELQTRDMLAAQVQANSRERGVGDHARGAAKTNKTVASPQVPDSDPARAELRSIASEDVFKAFGAPMPKLVKVVVLDADFTLWGEAVSEVGPEGVRLTEEFLAVQKKVLALKERGILLVISSRNTPKDVEAVFAQRPEMALRRQDLAGIWADDRNKAEHLKEIAEKLHLGLDSFVFLDDSPFERARVRQAFPEVLVPELPASPSEWPRILDDFIPPQSGSLTPEARNRTRLYEDQKRREQGWEVAKSVRQSFNDYLRGLGMAVEIFEETPASSRIDRVVELFERANRFNMTGRTFTREDLVDRLSGEHGTYRVFSLQQKDREGDQGIVAVMVVDCNGPVPVIESFCQSCRAWVGGMGGKVENLFMAYVVGKLGKAVGYYMPSEKNQGVKDVYARMGEGVVPVDVPGSDRKGFLFDRTTARIRVPDWFSMPDSVRGVVLSAGVLVANAQNEFRAEKRDAIDKNRLIKGWIRAYQSMARRGDLQNREKLAKALRRMGEMALPMIQTEIQRGNFEFIAVLDDAYLADPRLTSALIRAMEDKNADLSGRLGAAKVLGARGVEMPKVLSLLLNSAYRDNTAWDNLVRLVRNDARRGEVVDLLIKTVEDNMDVMDYGRQFNRIVELRMAAKVLGEIGPGAQRAVPSLMRLVKRKADSWAQENALKSLVAIDTEKKTVMSVLLDCQAHSSSEDVQAKASELLKIVNGEGLKRLPQKQERLERSGKDQGVDKYSTIDPFVRRLREGDSSERKVAVADLEKLGPDAFEALPALIETGQKYPDLKSEVFRALDAITFDRAFRYEVLGFDAGDLGITYSLHQVAVPADVNLEANTAAMPEESSNQRIEEMIRTVSGAIDAILPFLNQGPAVKRPERVRALLKWHSDIPMFDHLLFSRFPEMVRQLDDPEVFFAALEIERALVGHYVENLEFDFEIYCRDYGSHLGSFSVFLPAASQPLFDVYAPLFKEKDDLKRFIMAFAADIVAGRVSQVTGRQELAALFATHIQKMEKTGMVSDQPDGVREGGVVPPRAEMRRENSATLNAQSSTKEKGSTLRVARGPANAAEGRFMDGVPSQNVFFAIDARSLEVLGTVKGDRRWNELLALKGIYGKELNLVVTGKVSKKTEAKLRELESFGGHVFTESNAMQIPGNAQVIYFTGDAAANLQSLSQRLRQKVKAVFQGLQEGDFIAGVELSWSSYLDEAISRTGSLRQFIADRLGFNASRALEILFDAYVVISSAA